MKRYLYYLLMLVPLASLALVSCDDDDDRVPAVGVEATISGGVFENGEIYVTQGNDLTIDGLTLVNHTDKEGALGAVTYRWNHYMIGTTIAAPYTITFNTANQPVGRYLMQAEMPIYVVDYPICWGYIQYWVNVVAADEDLPDGGDIAPQHVTGIVQPDPQQ